MNVQTCIAQMLAVATSALLVTSNLTAQPVKELRDTVTASRCSLTGTEFARKPTMSLAEELLACGDTGPAVLARIWERLAAPDSATLLAVMQISAQLPDTRLMSAMLLRAEDVSSSLEVRSGAVAALAVYLDSSRWPKIAANPSQASVFNVRLVQKTHYSPTTVSRPIDVLQRRELRARLEALNVASSPQQLRYILTFLKQTDSKP